MANALLLSPFNESGGSRLQQETESVSKGYSRGFRCLVLFVTIVGLAPGQTLLKYFDLGTYGTTCCMATDVNGDVYVVGNIANQNLAAKVTVTKVDRANHVVYQFTFGGSAVDAPKAAVVHAEGNLFVVGLTSSADFPQLHPLVKIGPSTHLRGFISKVDPTGTHLLFSTFFGGSQSDAEVDALALDAQGNLFVTGMGDVPVTANAYKTTGASFVSKVSNAGDQILYSTFLGPVSDGLAIAVSADGTATAAGSTGGGFPITPGAFQTSCACGAFGGPNPTSSHSASFVSRLSADGSQLLWSTYLGGSGQGGLGGAFEDTVHALALTSEGDVVVAGITESPNFPVTPGAFQRTFRATGGFGIPANIFVSRLNSTGTALKFSTFLGGSVLEEFHGLQLDAQERPWVTGDTLSWDFPSLPNALNLGRAFVVAVAPDGSKLITTQMLPAGAAGTAVALDAAGNETLLGPIGSLVRIPAGGPVGTGILAQANGAAYSASGQVAPGEIISLYGTGLGPAAGVGARYDSTGKIATTLAGVQVLFDDTPAPMLYAGANQINAIVPFEVGGKTSTSMHVASALNASPSVDLKVVSSNPEIFTIAPTPPFPEIAQNAFAAALNADGTLNSSSNPAKPGSVVALFATGAGLFTQELSDGAIVHPPLSKPILPVSVLFDGQRAEVLYAGAALDLVAAALQVNVRVPANAAGSYHTVQLQVGGAVSDAVQVAVAF